MNQVRLILVLMVLFSSLSPVYGQQPDLTLSEKTVLVDERINIVVNNVATGEEITIRATTLDQRQRQWIAEARFVGGEAGFVNLDEQAPVRGTYDVADAMGLLWSAEPEVDGAQIGHGPGIDFRTLFELEVQGQVVDRDTLTRRFDDRRLIREPVDEENFKGVFYKPRALANFPTVVVFAGSDGGLASAEWRAALLASRGFAALAVAYFNYPGLADDLVEIPLEHAIEAVAWAREKEQARRVGVLGFSKGSELSLNVAARSNLVGAVVAISPSAYVWPGISDGPPETRSSWSWEGEPLAAIPWFVGPEAGKMFGQGPPFKLRLLYEESLSNASEAVREAAAIPVENIRAPILLVSGDEDGSWPATEMSEAVLARVKAAQKQTPIKHLKYAEAGHLLFWDYLPATATRNRGQIFGGTAKGYAEARASSWSQIQAFLREYLE